MNVTTEMQQLADAGGVGTRHDPPLVVDLAVAHTVDRALVGGKGVNLGWLLASGLPVPDGFCLTTLAYDAVTQAPEVRRALDEATTASETGLEAACENLRDAIRRAPVPVEIVAALAEALDRLGGEEAPVAVRSSATAEDLEDASFAGQQESFLNVLGQEAVLEAVRSCWASLWSHRAASYRRTLRYDSGVSLCVVVQTMVDARCAGVLFTADPVTGSRRHAVIDANPGLGEAVVSGAVNPDHLVVDRRTGEVVTGTRGDRTAVVRSVPHGGTRTTAEAPDGGYCLSAEEIAVLTRLGRQVEEVFGLPQDIEWAVDGSGAVLLTQSRAVTTLYPLPVRHAGSGDAEALFFCASYSWQGILGPITPMGLSALRLATASVVAVAGVGTPNPDTGPRCFVESGMRMFLDVTPAAHHILGRRALLGFLGLADGRALAVARLLLDDPRYAVRDRRRGPFVRAVVRMMVRHRIPARMLAAALRPERAVRRSAELRHRLEHATHVPADATSQERVDAVEHMILSTVGDVWARIVPLTAVGMLMLGIGGRLAGHGYGDDAVKRVMRGLDGNVTTEMDLALWQLADVVRADSALTALIENGDAAELAAAAARGTLPPRLSEHLASFLASYGFRAVAEVDLGVPRWSDDPTPLFAALQSYLRVDDPARGPAEQFTRAAAEARQAVEELAASSGPLRPVVRSLLTRARRLLAFRELAKYYNVYVLGQARAQLLVVGADLADRGVLRDPPEVFFLSLPQLRAVLGGHDAREWVDAQREEYRRESRRRYVPHLLLGDGSDPETLGLFAEPDDDPDLLRGTPVSAGAVTGTARVVMDPRGAALQQGEILVAPTTDPGWTPLFLAAAGLVMETGGANSHGSVVAREYGIPGVVGVPGATRAIRTGDTITVDGSTGSVRLLG